jgi:hydroxymethylglutaryl-CoA lyase
MSRIRIVEVGPRDGLQNQPALVPTAVKVAFVDALSEAGFDEIEASSFVSPKWVPQLADAAEVFRRIRRRPGVRYSALVPNREGLERALEAGVDKVAVFTAASETFTRKNINASIAESLERFRPVVAASPLPVRGYVSTAFHCPFEGPVDPAAALDVASRLIDLGVAELSIGDTIGRASPDQVRRLLEILLPRFGADRLALHFHDTYGRAPANARASADLGIRIFDASAGGIGGCPYAPGAAGNVATEALVELFAGQTGIDREKLAEAVAVVSEWVAKGKRETEKKGTGKRGKWEKGKRGKWEKGKMGKGEKGKGDRGNEGKGNEGKGEPGTES